MAPGKAKMAGAIFGLLLVGAITVLGILRAASADPDQIKAELAQEILTLNRIPPGEAIRKDEKAEEILASEEYRKYGAGIYLRLEKVHSGLHEAAELERSAQKVVPRFLARCADPEKVPPKELPTLADEARAHLGNYGGTRFGPPLRERLRKIEDLSTRKAGPGPATADGKVPAEGGTSGAELLVRAQHEVGEALRTESYSRALEIIDRFQKRTDDDDLRRRAKELREIVLRKARKASQALLERARVLAREGQPGEAIRLLDSALPNYKGLPESAALEVTRRKLGP